MIDSSIQSFNYYDIALHNALPVKPAEKPKAAHTHQEPQRTQQQTPKGSSLDTLGQGRLL